MKQRLLKILPIATNDKYFNKYKLPKIIKFNKTLLKNVDVIFTALPNGEAQKISKNLQNKIIKNERVFFINCWLFIISNVKKEFNF